MTRNEKPVRLRIHVPGLEGTKPWWSVADVAARSGGLAVTKQPWDVDDRWAVTHVASGRAVSGYCTKRKALAQMRRLLKHRIPFGLSMMKLLAWLKAHPKKLVALRKSQDMVPPSRIDSKREGA